MTRLEGGNTTMMPSQVRIGTEWFARVAGEYVRVRVVGDTQEGKKRFRVQRVDNGDILPKLRGAGELHDKPGPWAIPGGRERIESVVPKAAESAASTLVGPDSPATEDVARIIAQSVLTRLFEMVGESGAPKRRKSGVIARVTPPAKKVAR